MPEISQTTATTTRTKVLSGVILGGLILASSAAVASMFVPLKPVDINVSKPAVTSSQPPVETEESVLQSQTQKIADLQKRAEQQINKEKELQNILFSSKDSIAAGKVAAATAANCGPVLTQADFNNAPYTISGGVRQYYLLCDNNYGTQGVHLAGDITMPGGTTTSTDTFSIYVGDTATSSVAFDCQNHTLTGSFNINSWNASTVKNCTIQGSSSGPAFFAHQHSVVTNSASLNNDTGFNVVDDARVDGGRSVGRLGRTDTGFVVMNRAQVSNSSAKNHGIGFWFTDQTQGSNIIAETNREDGIILGGEARLTGCQSSYNGGYGLSATPYGTSTAMEISNCWAGNNSRHGYFVQGGTNGSVKTTVINNSQAYYNGYDGFRLYNSVKADEITASFNGQVVSPYDQRWGVALFGASATKVTANNNQNGIWVGSNAVLRDGYGACGNTNTSIRVSGTLAGAYRSENIINQGGSIVSATRVSCSGNPPGGGKLPKPTQ
jgi:hypothetical protein